MTFLNNHFSIVATYVSGSQIIGQLNSTITSPCIVLQLLKEVNWDCRFGIYWTSGRAPKPQHKVVVICHWHVYVVTEIVLSASCRFGELLPAAVEDSYDIATSFDTKRSKVAFKGISGLKFLRSALFVETTIAHSMCHIGHHSMTGKVNEDKCFLFPVTPILWNFISKISHKALELLKVSILDFNYIHFASA